MKKAIFAISLLLVSIGAIITLSSWSYNTIAPASDQVSEVSADDDWILIGEVTLSNYNNSSETIKANLYVREVANSLIYRVEYQGSYYATRWHDYSNTYHVTINGTTYRCDVPAIGNGSNSPVSSTLNKFVGTWHPQENESTFSALSISEQEGKLVAKIKWGERVYVDRNVQAQGNMINGSFMMVNPTLTPDVKVLENLQLF